MKSLLYLIILVLSIESCEKKSHNLIEQKTEKEEKIFVPKIGKKFFEYDFIDYYKSDYDEYSVLKLEEDKNKSKTDKFKFDVVIGNFPENITQTNFLESINKIGYTKQEIPKNKFPEIDKIFVDKTIDKSGTYACIAVYRDILVFKNQGKIVGIAKICFSCKQHQIIGTNVNTDNFGQNGDYEKLNTLLSQ